MFQDVTLWQLLERATERDAAALALTYGHEQWTFGELHAEAELAAAKLAALGVARGQKVAVWSANAPEWVFLEFGLARLGAVLVTVNTALGRDDVTYLLGDCDAEVLVLGSGVRGNDLPAVWADVPREKLPRLREVVCLENAERELASRGCEARVWNELDAQPVPAADVALDDPINMQYTSGTTGFPKGVMLSSRNIVNNGWRTGVHLGFAPTDRVLCQVPLFHCFGCVIAVLGAYTHGASLHLVRTFDPESSLAAISGRSITAVHGVPTMFQALLDHPDAGEHDLSALRTGVMAGAVCPPSLMRRLIDEWDVREMCVGYGLTEASPAVTFTPRSDPPEERCGTVGVPIEGTEVRLVDADSGEDGDRGELWVRGEQVMLGYYGKPDATAEARTADGWLRTGDLAERDARGRLRIVGRIKELILRGGENVYPAEVEEAIRAHPGVAQVAVFGVPDERLGENVACAVVPHADERGEGLSAEDVRAYLDGRISKVKIPASVEIVSDLPLTASGKIQRFVLTQRFAERQPR